MIKVLTQILTFVFFIAHQTALSAVLSSGERITIDSNILQETREIQILLPESYLSNTNATYPVIYLIDGDYTFHGISGMLDFLANKGQLIPDVIVVAIADKGTERYRQYMTPKGLTAPFKKEGAGKAEQFLSFITKEVKPYITNNYRAADNAILMGHSMGGLFVLNALFESPNAFEHFVSVSPSVWLNDHAIMVKAKTFIEKDNHKPTSLHLSLGDENRMGLYGVLQLLDETQPKNLRWDFSHYPNENHNSVGLIALRDHLKKIFKGWYISDSDLSDGYSPEQLIKHYQSLLSTLKINQPIPTPSIKSAIRYFYRQEKTDEISALMAKVKQELPTSEQAFIIMLASYVGHFDSPESALKILQQSEDRFNNSVEYIKSIASTYEQLENYTKASSYYEKALKLATLHKSNQWQLNIIEAKLLKNNK